MGSRAPVGRTVAGPVRSAAQSVTPPPDAARQQAMARAALYAAPRTSPLVPLVAVGCGVALLGAWQVREEMYLVAGRDVGYALGILGLAMMVLLLGYPLRKRLPRTRPWGPLRTWFHGHMVLGVLGPVAVLLHCNFQLGSINSTVALLSTLLVGSSGFVGRFAYTRIHHGLFGRRQHFAELRAQLDALKGDVLSKAPALAGELERFGGWAAASEGGVLGAAARFFRVGARARRLRRAARRGADRHSAAPQLTIIDAYLRAGRRVAQIGIYERIFSLWHAFHLPLCFFLYGAAIVHVIAVHLY